MSWFIVGKKTLTVLVSQRLGFLENVSFGHCSVNLFASVLIVTEGLESQDHQMCQETHVYWFEQKSMIDLPFLH